MARAIDARNGGDIYQGRIFWRFALLMLQESNNIVRVEFESDDIKSFDDVVVHFSPSIPSDISSSRISRQYIQVKWHTDLGHVFGYDDLTKADFIHATSFSLLEKLKDGVAKCDDETSFIFLTNARAKTGDEIRELIRADNRSLKLEVLFNSKTDNSKMGKVRKCWREHLCLTSNDQLTPILRNFSIQEQRDSLDDLKGELIRGFNSLNCNFHDASHSDFRLDAIYAAWRKRDVKSFDRSELIEALEKEGLKIESKMSSKIIPAVWIKSFSGFAPVEFSIPESSTLSLVHLFSQRYIKNVDDWQSVIKPQIQSFTESIALQFQKFNLILDTHLSLSALLGYHLNSKSGREVILYQKGRSIQYWSSNDNSKGGEVECDDQYFGTEGDLVLEISITHNVSHHVNSYITKSGMIVANKISIRPKNGESSVFIGGGEHSISIVDQIVRFVRSSGHSKVIHVFAACPSSFMFYFGQSASALGKCILYEFDFEADKIYHKSLTLES
ncbi:MAG: hypothetical protein RL204_61 [Bacteroidota bacterium]|jgi:hypothetical protein